MTDLRYNIQLEVVTPLSVGAGNHNEWVKGADFIQYNNKLYVLDLKKMVAFGIDMDKMSAYFINQDEDEICKLLGKDIEELSRYVFALPVRTNNPVKTFLRTQMFDRPLVPGSSIKGSIRSALFNSLRDDGERSNDEVFGKLKRGDDFMRFLKIGDVEMRRTILANTKLFNLHVDASMEWTGGWKQDFKKTIDTFQATGFNTLYECVPPGDKGLGVITMAATAFQQLLRAIDNATPHADRKKALMNEGVSGLFRIINNVTRSYLRKERTFFSHYEADRSDEIVECIDKLLRMIPDDNSSCLMKMAAGTGFHSITGNWQYDSFINTGENKGKKKYKSRKIVEYDGKLMLMGFVKLFVPSEEEVAGQMKAVGKEHDEMLEDIRTSPQRLLDMQRQKQQEKVEKTEKEGKLRQLKAEYDDLIARANQLYLISKNKEAEELALKAENLLPDGPDHQSLLERIRKDIKREEEQRRIDGETLNKLSQPLSSVLVGKTSIGNILGHLEKWLKLERNSFGDEEIVALAGAFNQLPNKEAKKLKSSQRRISSLIGDENASAVFAKLEELKKT